jgi:hypothetical protein
MYDVCCENAKATQRQPVDSVVLCVLVGEEICRGKITIVATTGKSCTYQIEMAYKVSNTLSSVRYVPFVGHRYLLNVQDDSSVIHLQI